MRLLMFISNLMAELAVATNLLYIHLILSYDAIWLVIVEWLWESDRLVLLFEGEWAITKEIFRELRCYYLMGWE